MPSRIDRAVIGGDPRFDALGRLDVPILEITQAADVGMGSFYHHFASREDLLRVAGPEFGEGRIEAED